MTYISRCLTCHEPVDGSIAYCVACRQIDAINRQTKQAKDLSEQNAERMAQQTNRQERLELDRIRELRQLEEYRQREKLLALILGYRQQQALELAEQMRLEKEEEAEDKRIADEWDRYYATPEGQAYKRQKALERDRSEKKADTIVIAVVLLIVLVVVTLWVTNHGFIATLVAGLTGWAAILGAFHDLHENISRQ